MRTHPHPELDRPINIWFFWIAVVILTSLAVHATWGQDVYRETRAEVEREERLEQARFNDPSFREVNCPPGEPCRYAPTFFTSGANAWRAKLPKDTRPFYLTGRNRYDLWVAKGKPKLTDDNKLPMFMGFPNRYTRDELKQYYETWEYHDPDFWPGPPNPKNMRYLQRLYDKHMQFRMESYARASDAANYK